MNETLSFMRINVNCVSILQPKFGYFCSSLTFVFVQGKNVAITKTPSSGDPHAPRKIITILMTLPPKTEAKYAMPVTIIPNIPTENKLQVN